VTVSSFSDRPIAEDAMMGFLAQQMSQLRQANGLRVNGEEEEIALQMAASLGPAAGPGEMTVIRSDAPVPRQRVAGTRAGSGAGASAPDRAPAAPRRPG